MLGCQTPGARVWLSESDNPKRKYALTWELVELESRVLVGLHTGRTNALVAEAIDRQLIPSLSQYRAVKAEIAIPGAKGRFDWLLQGDRGDCYLEVKNVTASVEEGVALFPDAVSVRATRHARELARLQQAGISTALVFCVQRSDVKVVRPAKKIDPDYAQALSEAAQAGVTIEAISCDVSVDGIIPARTLPVVL